MEGSRIQALLVVALFTLLTPSLGEQHVTPRFPFIPASPVDLIKCFSSLLSVEGCVTQIYKSFITGKFENIGPACCVAFKEVDEKCWPQMFPLNPFFPPLLKNGCSRFNAAAPTHMKPRLPIIVGPGFTLRGSPIDLTKCLSSLESVKGCLTEIHKSVLTGKFENVGAMCCNAFLAMDAKCWPQVFPLNPFFAPLLKKECSRINRVAPAHNLSK